MRVRVQVFLRSAPWRSFSVTLAAAVMFALLVTPMSGSGHVDPGHQQRACDYPDTVKRYACLIRQEADGAVNASGKTPATFYAALQAMNVVQTLVPSGRYSLFKRNEGAHFQTPGTDAAQCLELGYGICGNHVATFNTLLAELGIPTRIVQFFFPFRGEMLSHIASEVLIRGKWVFLDVSNGSIYLRDREDLTSYLSIAEIRERGYANVHPLRNDVATWFFSRQETSYDTLLPMKVEDVDVVVDGEGWVRTDFDLSEREAASGNPQLGYIGDNTAGNGWRPAGTYWKQAAGRYRLTVAAVQAGCEHGAELCVDGTCTPFDGSSPATEIEYVAAGGRSELTIRSDDDICYAALRNISIERTDQRLARSSMEPL